MKNIILLAVIYLVYRTIKSAMLKKHNQDIQENFSSTSPQSADDVMIKDPQCGVYFPQREGIGLRDGNEVVYFCSEKCRDEYINKGKN